MEKWLAYFLVFIYHLHFVLNNNVSLVYDYCSLEDSFIASKVANDIKNYYGKFFDQESENCVFLNEKFFSIDKELVDIASKISYSHIKCSKCQKSFKSKELLLIHYKLFHLNPLNNDDLKICPADLCLFLNCRRFTSFYDKVKYNSLEREMTCDKDLENYNRKGCLNIFKSCLKKGDEDDEKNLEITYDFYINFCKKIDCELYKVETNLLQKPSTFYEVIRILIMYLSGVFTLIYLLIIWVSHYQ